MSEKAQGEMTPGEAEEIVQRTSSKVYSGNALEFYDDWDSPDVIISDGAYGIGGFRGDPKTPEGLGDWYLPHIREWSQRSHAGTTLWFWNTEVGWANVHPVLIANGWEYIQLITWDKGIGHIAGNVNSRTIRSMPVVTEVSALYRRKPEFIIKDMEGDTVIGSLQQWLRAEWKRSGLPMSQANEACGVKSAATRKWLTADAAWYAPPPEAVEAMAAHCNQYGDPDGAPYFEVEGAPDAQALWTQIRSQWNHRHGLTNVWEYPAVRNTERVRGSNGKYLHTNQKPLELMNRQIQASSSVGDVIWEPFGGLCSVSVAAASLGRKSFAAETDKEFVTAARDRVDRAWSQQRLFELG